MKSRLKKYLLITLGTLSLVFGVIGMILPLVPTTPFLLLSAYFYLKGSNKLYLWLIHHKILGLYIYSYIHDKSLSLSAKISAIILLWLTLILSMVLMNQIYLYIILSIIGVGVTIHLLTLKTLSRKQIKDMKMKNTKDLIKTL